MRDQNNNAILYFFTLMTCLFLFRGSFPVDDVWGFPFSLIFCALAYASGVVAIGSLKALIPPRDTLMYMIVYPAYLLVMAVNMGPDHVAAQTKIIGFIVSSLPAYYLGWVLGQDKDWPTRIWHVLLTILGVIAVWHTVNILQNQTLFLYFQSGTYQNLGMLVTFCFMSSVLMQSYLAWPMAVAVSLSWYISAFLAACVFLACWLRTHAKQAVLLGTLLVASAVLFAQGGTGGVHKLSDKIATEIIRLEGTPSRAEFDRGKLFYEGAVGFIDSPVVGHGTASFLVNNITYPHNVLIEHMYEHGVIGFLLVFFVLYYPFKKVWVNLDGSIHARMVGAFLLATLVFSSFGGQTFSRLLLFVLGLACALPPTDKTLKQILRDLFRYKKTAL